MNLQIFGTKKCFDTKKTIRFFKERGISFQWIDLSEKPMSRGELLSVVQSVKDVEALLDPACRDQEALALVRYISESQRTDKLLENQQVIKTPVVRDGKKATVGYQPDIWKNWLA